MSKADYEGLCERLAEYFSGPCVAAHSMGLSLSGGARVTAEAFFKVRTALGISGYVTREEAAAQITSLIGDHPHG